MGSGKQEEKRIPILWALTSAMSSAKKTDVYYHVNMITGYCECPVGQTMGPCKHKTAVSSAFKTCEFNVLPLDDAKMRALYHYIGTGKTLKDNWYRSIGEKET